MTIDCNATLGNWPFRRLSHARPGEFMSLMDRNGIDLAWAAPFEGIMYKSAYEANEDFRGKLGGFEDRLTQLAVVNPTYPIWQDELAEYVQWGCPGVRLYPSYHGYDLAAPELAELLSEAKEAGLFVQVATRVQDERLHHQLAKVAPLDLSPLPALAREFESVPLIVLNASNAELAAIHADGYPANLFTDISHIEGAGGVGKEAERLGAEHIVFGSHAPFLYMESAALKMKESDLTPEQRDLICHGNAARIVRPRNV